MRKPSWLLITLAVACTDTVPTATTCLVLEEVRRFGSAEASPSLGSDDDSVLGDIRGAVVSPTGEVLILDRYAHQIVAFNEQGDVTRTIRGGRGTGPGEFQLPMHLAATDRGVAVIDYDLQRTTEFSWSGDLLRTVVLKTPAPWQQVLLGDTVWVTYSNPDSSGLPAFMKENLVDGTRSPGPALDPVDQAYGLAVGMVRIPDGTLLVTTARPGVWMEVSNSASLRRGSPRFPADSPPTTEQTGPRQSRVTPSQHTASGLAVIGDSIVVQGSFSLLRPFDWNDPPRRDEGVRSLGVYDREGNHLATLPLPGSSRTTFMAADSRAGRLFMPIAEPYPLLVEYRLMPCAVDT